MEKIDISLFILRVGFGLSMVAHGWNKVFSPSGLSGTAGWFNSIGMKWPALQARVAASTEIVAGLLMTIGLFTGAASLAFVSLMVVAIVTVHWKVGYFIFLPNGGWEYCAAIMLTATALSISGPGDASLDIVLGLPTGYGIAAFPFGLLLAVCHLTISFRPSSHSVKQ
jgi:putative oxidoreductase